MKNKTCTKCNTKQSINKFYKIKGQPDGYDYYCKECRKTTTLKSHRFGKRKPKCTVDDCERINYAKSLCRIHYERLRRNGNTDLVHFGRYKYGKSPSQQYEYIRRNHLKRMFKLTPEQYEEMAKNGCEICGIHALPHKKLHVDHDHKCCPPKYNEKTNRLNAINSCGLCVRGIVCDKCNQAIGRYERGILRPEYPLRNEVIMYVAKYAWVISDRMDAYDKEQGNR
jgi:hypothetical protein